MHVIGIISEYNPFHAGHGYHIARSRTLAGEDTAVAAVMSGNWVQRGESALCDKWTRARLALLGGADLVLELPTVWAMSSAESFARGGAAILEATGVVDTLSFGSEGGQVDKLAKIAACLDSPAYTRALRTRLAGGDTFALCRQQSVEELLGRETASLLSAPNNNLGIEYIRALTALNSSIRPMTVTRVGAAHDSAAQLDGGTAFLSASQLRSMVRQGAWDQAAPYLLPHSGQILAGRTLPGLSGLEQGILTRLRTMTAEDWAALPDSGLREGLPQRLERAGKGCTSLDHFFELTKTRRYTRARLNRLVCWAYLGLKASDIPDAPPYLRVLGFNQRGQEVLKAMKETAQLPILTKPAHARTLDEAGRRLFELESRCTDLYDLSCSPIPQPGREWRENPVRLEEGAYE